MGRIPAKAAPLLVILSLALLVAAVYRQAGDHQFLRLDDPAYVYENPRVRNGLTRDGVAWALTATEVANWHPLTWLSHMTDVEAFGLDPGWHHRINVLLHGANTVLLFLVLAAMTGATWPSALVAALFGVHPLHVESVAWVAERKDVLSTLFWILTMGAYLRYVRRPGSGRYLAVAAPFALGLLCKPMLVTLPFVLLLLDYWPLGRLEPFSPPGLARRALEKIPLLVLSALSCLVTILAQSRGEAVSSLVSIPLGTRLANAATSYASYLWKTAWPASLSVFYPLESAIPKGTMALRAACASLLLAGISLLAVRHARRRPYLAVGWFWYLGTLVPVIGLIQVGGQAMADRYTYIPLVGVFIALAWGVHEALGERRLPRIAATAAAAAVVLALADASYAQVRHWRTNVDLFSHALRVSKENWFAWYQLGAEHGSLGRYAEAVEEYRTSIRIQRGYAPAWYNLGVAYGNLRRYPEAVDAYREAAHLAPGNASTWNNLGVVYALSGQHSKALEACREAVRLKPDYANALYNLGITCHFAGLREETLEAYRRLLRVDPRSAEALARKVGPGGAGPGAGTAR